MSNSQSPGDFARLYKEKGLEGGHLIKLGPRNDEAARQALEAWPGLYTQSIIVTSPLNNFEIANAILLGGLQIGGGITDKNALSWLELGASKVSPYRAQEPELYTNQCIAKHIDLIGYCDIIFVP